MSLSSQQGVPLLVLHGGPQVPSDYLFDLAKVDYRSVVFYDQVRAATCPSQTGRQADMQTHKVLVILCPDISLVDR